MSTKKSIRFINDQKVRAVWSDTDSKMRKADVLDNEAVH